MTERLPTLKNLKQQAKRLRAQTCVDGPPISHSQSLELLAHQYSYKDWNTLYAAVGDQPQPAPFAINTRVSGLYLGQAFDGEIIAVVALAHSCNWRVTINFDNAVDVIEFDGMSNMRQRVTSELTANGQSLQKTTHHGPAMQLDM